MRYGDRILRAVNVAVADDIDRLLGAKWFRDRIAAGSLPETQWVSPPELAVDGEFRWLEHACLGFPCYPHEITASQLHAAAELTLSLAREALDHGWLLKDASAWNVLFDQGRPVFCDLLSFTRAEPTGLWQAYAQFQRHFIIPLLMHRELGVRTSRLFVTRRDGVEPPDARSMIRGINAWRQPALEAVTLPTLFGNRPGPSVTGLKKRIDPQLHRFLLARTYDRLQRSLHRLVPAVPRDSSKWANYEAERDHYSSQDMQVKHKFVQEALADPTICTVLDLGCNTGEFSMLAAAAGKQVVAADLDEQCLENLQRRLESQQSRIQPVLLDIARPTPAIGWMNEEVPAFLERATGHFDCIMMLGLIHHLLVSERATLPGIMELLRSLAAEKLIVEWIDKEDPRFRQIAGINSELYVGLTRESFESAVQSVFKVDRREILPSGTRTLYVCSARQPDQ